MSFIEKIEKMERELAELKAQATKETKEDWWTPLGFDHEPQTGEWVLAWDSEKYMGKVAFKFIRRTEGEIYDFLTEYGNFLNIAPFPMPQTTKLGLWVAVTLFGKTKFVGFEKPTRDECAFTGWAIKGSNGSLAIPKGHPIDLLTDGMTWADEPREV